MKEPDKRSGRGLAVERSSTASCHSPIQEERIRYVCLTFYFGKDLGFFFFYDYGYFDCIFVPCTYIALRGQNPPETEVTDSC